MFLRIKKESMFFLNVQIVLIIKQTLLAQHLQFTAVDFDGQVEVELDFSDNGIHVS